jgi:hypothetical protein
VAGRSQGELAALGHGAEASRPDSDAHALSSMSGATSVLNSHTSQPMVQDNMDGLTDRSSAPSHSQSVSAILQGAGLGATATGANAAGGGEGSTQRPTGRARNRSQSVHLTPEQMHQARHVLQHTTSAMGAGTGHGGARSVAAPGPSGLDVSARLGQLEAALRSEGVSHLLDRIGSDKRNSDTSSLYAGLPTSPSALVIPYSTSMSRTSANTALSPAPSAARGLLHETSMQSTGAPMSARSLSHTVSRTSYGPSSGRSTAHTHLHHSRLPSGVSTMSAAAALASLGAAAGPLDELVSGGASPPRVGGMFVPGLSTMLEAPEPGSNSSRELGRIPGPSGDGVRASHGSHRLRRRSVGCGILLTDWDLYHRLQYQAGLSATAPVMQG